MEHVSAHDLEAERCSKLHKYLWTGVMFSNRHTTLIFHVRDISLPSFVIVEIKIHILNDHFVLVVLYCIKH